MQIKHTTPLIPACTTSAAIIGVLTTTPCGGSSAPVASRDYVVVGGSGRHTSPGAIATGAGTFIVVLVVRIVVKGHGVLRGLVRFEEVGDTLLALNEDLDKVGSNLGVLLIVVERSRETLVTDTRGTSCSVLATWDDQMGLLVDNLTNAVDILSSSTMQSTRKVEVDYMHDILDVQATSRNTSGDEDRAFGRAEGTSVES